MYNAYFNLKRNPFDLTPDPSCFVPTPQHNEALAALYYGVRRHKGFVVVTGEVGHREDSIAPMPASSSRKQQGYCLRISFQQRTYAVRVFAVCCL